MYGMNNEKYQWEIMKKTQRFQIEKHEGEYKDWPLKSYLIDDGVKTSTKLPGYDLLASFAIDNGKFLLILEGVWERFLHLIYWDGLLLPQPFDQYP